MREETGIEARIREPLGSVRYWYRRRGLRVFKTVRFWLCDYVGGELGGNPADSDWRSSSFDLISGLDVIEDPPDDVPPGGPARRRP